MLRKIIEKLGIKEVLCPEASDIAKKIHKMNGEVTIKRQDGELFTIDADAGIIGGWIAGTDKKGKSIDLDLCGKHYYKIA